MSSLRFVHCPLTLTSFILMEKRRPRNLWLGLALLTCSFIGVVAYYVPPTLSVSAENFSGVAPTIPAIRQSAQASIEHLAQVMDQFHNRFPVYDDVSSAGNHFPAFAKLPDETALVEINGSITDNPHSGATAIRFRLQAGRTGGFYFLNGILPPGATAPQLNFGIVPDAGLDLTGATALTFWVRGAVGGEKIDFFMGGVGRDPNTGIPFPNTPYPDSSKRRPGIGSIYTLSTNWQQVTIPLTDPASGPLSYVLGGIGWFATSVNNPNGAEFYMDDIQYELNATRLAQRLNEPRFLQSFTTFPFQSQPPPVNDFDLVLRNAAFTYDNALALLAFLADGTPDSLRRARLLGDAFVYASLHDRSYNDGRFRNAYAAGDISLPPGWIPNGRIGTVPVSGFYDEAQMRFIEIEQESIDTGNNAWVIIALLALHQRTTDAAYLEAARRVGLFLETFRNTIGTYQGFQGGLSNFPEGPNPMRRIYASTEHNLDLVAAFTAMFNVTGEARWQADAQHARQFVLALWDTQSHCYLAGTTNPDTRNTLPGQLPLDVQAWSVLALPDALTLHPETLLCAEQNHRTTNNGFSGFDFNEDRDGVWFEGTGQMATAYAVARQGAATEALRDTLQRAQLTPPFGDGRGLAAASCDGLTTGFGFLYHRRLHIGATAWNAFAQSGFNPYYQTFAPAVQFSATTLTANESAGQATLNVTRMGDASAATVDYATQDNFAFNVCNAAGNNNQRCDYTPARGTLNFAAGETSKSFDVLINDDAYSEGSETVNLVLSNPTGATLGPNANAALTITDNDTMGGANRTFVANLSSAQEVPANASTATGGGTVVLNAAENQITVNMTFSGLGSAQTAAHIHSPAPVGVNAPVLFNLGTGAIANATFAVTPAQVAQMRAGMFYFNVHTANFPGGEIRGQIASQPLENARFFVRQQYADFLSREPDTAGFDFWTGQIVATCGADLACTRQRRVDVSNAFFFELEFQQTGAFVYRLYRAAYGATQPFPNPESATLPNYTVFVNDRARVVGGASLAAAQLALANAFTARTEFLARYPAGQTAAQFVDAILGNIQAATGANLASQRDALIALHGTGGRGAVVYRLADDNLATNPINNRAFIDAEYNRAFVITQYYGYLRRDADFAGFNFWLGVVNQFPLRSPTGQNGMVCAFITSQEYQERFSAGVTRANQECP